VNDSPSAEPDGPDGLVELRVPASSVYVSVLRSVTAGLAARCDLTLDEIEDLRIAVDEACALLIPLAREGAVITARFVLSADQLVVTTSVAAVPGSEPNREGFGWTVLDALASEVDIQSTDGDIAISLTKRREPAHP
jgi:serine/threonine-protein kinase RsbW